MKPAVRAAFVPFSAPLEGVCAWLYLDIKGLVTTGIGNLVDPISTALGLPFRRPDGALASRSEIAAEWERVKARGDLRMRGGGYFRHITTLRLDDEGIKQVVSAKLDLMDRHLAKRFPGYEFWPADAQLATLSMAWACGPAFHFPNLEAALNAGDFLRASNECRIKEEGNPGVKPRNVHNRTMYRNAAVVAGTGFLDEPLDPDVLYWPRDLESEPVDREADTKPDVEPYRPEATVHAMPDMVVRCARCGLAGCNGTCPEAA